MDANLMRYLPYKKLRIPTSCMVTFLCSLSWLILEHYLDQSIIYAFDITRQDFGAIERAFDDG